LTAGQITVLPRLRQGTASSEDTVAVHARNIMRKMGPPIALGPVQL